MMNWKGFGSGQSWPNLGTAPAFAWMVWGKPRIAGGAAMIRTDHVPNKTYGTVEPVLCIDW
jgi:hypothetical protein